MSTRIHRPTGIFVGSSLSHPGSSVFVPAGSPVARWDASAIVGLSHNDPCPTWPDLITSLDLTAAGAEQPTYKTNAQNSLPALDFDGGDGIDFSGTIWDHTASDITMFVVSKITSGTTGGFIEISQGDTVNSNGWMNFVEGGNFIAKTPDAPTPFQVSGGATDANTNLHVLRHDSSETELQYWINGTSKGTAAAGAIVGSLNYISVGTIGGNIYRLTGHICEIIIYNTPLSTGDRQLNEAGLTTKWGL